MTNNNIYFVANWKMNGQLSLIKRLKNVVILSNNKKYKKIKIIYCPPFTLISKLFDKIKKSKIIVGSQDCSYEDNYGPFTGDVSPKLIKEIGAKYVILGHSERRLKGDTNKIINRKIHAALKQKLKIILCIGETLKDRKKNRTFSVLKKQLLLCLKKINNIDNIIVAYEPIWSIGTGVIPLNNILEHDISKIIKFLKSKFKNQKPKIIYGGSVNPENIVKLKHIKNINGFLVGGASLYENKFVDIIKKTTI